MGVDRKYYLLLIAFLGLCYTVSAQRKDRDKPLVKAYKYGDYQSIMRYSEELNPDDIAEQFKIIARASFEYGDFEKAANFFEKSSLLDSNLQEKDILNYCYSLIKCGKEEKVLSDDLFLSHEEKSNSLRQLLNAAASHDFYRNLKLDSISTEMKDLKLKGILPRYGLSFCDYYLYYAYSENSDKKGDEELYENQVFATRVNDFVEIGQVRLSWSGSIGAEGTVIYNNLPRNRRIVTLTKDLAENADFYTEVPGNGKPERIEIVGDKYPAFPYNSDEYACAMPFFEKETGRLYFCSTMVGGRGGWDIYYVDFDGVRWGQPISLGNEVNSAFDELFPVEYDNMLFFSSEGWEGFGGFDNYVLTPDERRINLLPFNSEGDDYSFQIVEKEPFRGVGVLNQNAEFYSSSKDLGTLLADIENVIVRKKDEVDLAAIAEMKAEMSGSEEPIVIPKAESKKAIKTETKSVVFTDKPQISESLNEGALSVLPSTVRTKQLGEIFFETNSPVIQSKYYSVLDNLVDQIIADDLQHIIVVGQTDRSGIGRHNDYLSYMRAHSVVEYLKNRLNAGNIKRFFTIVAGEGYAKSLSEDAFEDRKVVVSMSNKELEYDLVYVYRTEAKQTLRNVAELFNNDLNLLKRMNNLELLDNEQLLLVGIQGIHLVKRGETLFHIASMYNCTADMIQKVNRKKDRKVFAGEKLIIPLATN